MSCSFPREVGFKEDGLTISWHPKTHSKEYPLFKLPCSKCIECRLDYAKQWAVRCVHEAQMHPKNSFITLTYKDEHLRSPRLHYPDFQEFMKKLRHLQEEPMGMFVTGEYGEKNKRPHWHALIFNWRPPDCKVLRKNERGDIIYSSVLLDQTWGLGKTELGSVTLESAGYCARYAAKKLVHGKDQEHDYQPISKKSSKHAIGKKWLERYWPDVFNYGNLRLSDGTTTIIPRYYEKWLQKHHPGEWYKYIHTVKYQKIQAAEKREKTEKKTFEEVLEQRRKNGKAHSAPLTKNQIKNKISKKNLEERLNKHLKL